MARPKRTATVKATDLTIADLRRLLVVKERMVSLEVKRDKLRRELASVEAEIKRVESGGAATGRGRPRRRPGRRPGRKAGRRPGRPRGAARKAARKKVTRRATKKAVAGRRRPGKGTLQDVVANLIRGHGGSMSFQDILHTIQSRQLVKTRSKNFANVLRRTLSTSKTIKRVSRGVYGA